MLFQCPDFDFPGIRHIQDDGRVAGQRDPDFAWAYAAASPSSVMSSGKKNGLLAAGKTASSTT